MISEAHQLWANRDYFGGTIYDSQRDNMGLAYLEHLINANLPFSVRNALKLQQTNAPMLDQSLSFWGANPAPGFITNPDKELKWMHRQDIRGYKAREKEQGRIRLQ